MIKKNLRVAFIFSIMLISAKLFAQPSPGDSCVITTIIRFRLFEGNKLIKKNNEQYVVHTSDPEAESAWKYCPWQKDSVYAFMLALDNTINNPPYIIYIVRKEDTMEVVIKDIYYNWFYIDSIPFMTGRYEIELPEHSTTWVDGKYYLYQFYKYGNYGWVLTPPSWKAIRVDDKKKVKKGMKNKKK